MSSTAEGHTHAQPAGRSGSTNDVYVPVRPDTRRADQRDEPREETGAGLPWATLPAVTGPADHGTARLTIRSPSGAEATSGAPFGGVNDEELARLIGALARSRWPVRRSRRRRTSSGGTRIALRETLARARRYGWEPMELARDRPVHRPRPVVFLCDVSQSMQPHAAMYLQFMRALALTTDCEVFAFATSLTRLTPAMRRRSAAEAVAEAADEVVDRFGGTRIATNITAMLRSVHGCRTRGGVVIIASDGWDHDDPDELGAAMVRLHRRAHTVVWMNPRADAPGFAPLVGSMRAALPYCDSFLPAGDLGGLADVIDAVAATA
nr:VWA domain-containing protein [Spelaeicoccus albus]